MRGLVIAAAAVLIGSCGPPPSSKAERYRLVHAVGNDELVLAGNLTKAECEGRREDRKRSATAAGTYNEATGYGSITCLPESLFE
ncbi:MAG: hypothetical protein ACT7A5_32125 [Ferrovibrionaceae bacterium]|uniref:hypothetical protein n=1 Tax=Brevundimonas sp. TaxID=1871086 RepID=UPI00403443FC